MHMIGSASDAIQVRPNVLGLSWFAIRPLFWPAPVVIPLGFGRIHWQRSAKFAMDKGCNSVAKRPEWLGG